MNTCIKKSIRREVLERRDGLSVTERNAGTFMMTDRIMGHQWYYQASRLLIFASFGSEIDTTDLIEEALKQGKRVYVPKIEGDDMEFYEIHAFSELKPGYRQIPEPDGMSEKYVYDENVASKTLMLMPGVAFDVYKNRIGYGKGYYDRYLSDKPFLQIKTIAIGFKCQLVENIPFEEYDVKPYQIILV